MARLRQHRIHVALSTVLVAMGAACTEENAEDSAHQGDAGSPGSSAEAGAAGAAAGSAVAGSSATGGAAGEQPNHAAAGKAGSPAQGGGTGATETGGTGAAAGETGSAAAAGSSQSKDCADIGEQGICSGDVLEYCEGDELLSVDCAKVGATCSVVDGEATCTDVERAAACGDLTPLGTCDGAIIRYCDETGLVGAARAINCAAYGQLCDPTAARDGGALCVSQGNCPSGVDEDGVCDNNELRFCEEGELYVFDCGVDECRSVDGFADCFAPDFEDGCGSVLVEGTCVAGVLHRCLGNVVTREDCALLGLECVENTAGASCQRTECPAECVAGYECADGVCVPETEPEREWTFAVYSVADNSLSDSLWRDLNEMEAVGSGTDVQIVAQIEFSSMYSFAVPEQYQTGAYRMVVERDDDLSSSVSLQGATELGDDVNMGSGVTLTEFLQWTAENHPARRMALILANHGSGYQGGFFDDGSHDAMTLRELVTAVRDSGVHVDLLGMDACMMGTHEVGMAFRGVADTMVASPDTEPGGGYSYTPILTALEQDPDMTPSDVGEVIVNSYTAAYEDAFRGHPVTMGTTDLSQLPGLNERLAGFTETALTQASGMRSSIKSAVSSAELLRAETMRTITDVGSILAVFSQLDGPIGRSAGDVNTWFAESGPVLSAGGTQDKESTSGLGIFLPEIAWSHSAAYSAYWASTSFLPLQPWFAFVGNLATNEQEVAAPGEGAVDSFSVVLTWGDEPNGTESSADLDLYVYEPNGDFGTPANGKTTANGMLSGDSYDTEVSTESYELKPEHQPGKYTILVNLYYIDIDDKAYPRLRIYRNDLPGGVRTLLRGKVIDRELVEIPMDDSNLLQETINPENFQDVLNLDYSNLWFATTLEVSASEEELDEG